MPEKKRIAIAVVDAITEHITRDLYARMEDDRKGLMTDGPPLDPMNTFLILVVLHLCMLHRRRRRHSSMRYYLTAMAYSPILSVTGIACHSIWHLHRLELMKFGTRDGMASYWLWARRKNA